MLKIFVCLLFVLIPTYRLPAPIAEEEMPTATPAKPKPKIEKREASSETTKSSSASGFDGTWTGSMSKADAGHNIVTKAALVIKQATTADLIQETTRTLINTGFWTGVPDQYKTVSPVYT